MGEYDFNTYQDQAMGVRKGNAWQKQYPIVGFPGEVGELLSVYAKAGRDGEKDNHKEMIFKELGDCLWFIAAIAKDEGFALSDVAKGNIDKLQDRVKRGVLGGSGDNR
jgi:NTP pyrophosphatase (non-canonical NTP hydrolase)